MMISSSGNRKTILTTTTEPDLSKNPPKSKEYTSDFRSFVVVWVNVFKLLAWRTQRSMNLGDKVEPSQKVAWESAGSSTNIGKLSSIEIGLK